MALVRQPISNDKVSKSPPFLPLRWDAIREKHYGYLSCIRGGECYILCDGTILDINGYELEKDHVNVLQDGFVVDCKGFMWQIPQWDRQEDHDRVDRSGGVIECFGSRWLSRRASPSLPTRQIGTNFIRYTLGNKPVSLEWSSNLDIKTADQVIEVVNAMHKQVNQQETRESSRHKRGSRKPKRYHSEE